MKTYLLDQAMQALSALREAAGFGPELLPIQEFVVMISDEVKELRSQGKTDAEIAAFIEEHSGIQITASEIAEHYEPSEAGDLPNDRSFRKTVH